MKISIKREQNNARIGSAEREKVRTKFKTMKNFLSMAALALVGAMMTGCSGDDDGIADIPQQPENKSKIVTLTTTVGFDDAASTRALTAEGVKTFAVGEQMAIVYSNGSGMVTAVSRALKADDIKDAGTIASFTFDLETPDKSIDVTYIYPASMARADGSINYDALANQDGTLASLASNLDLATYEGEWLGENLPSCTLENRLAILAITLKDEAGTSDITSGTTKLTVSDGTNTYNVSRSAVAGPIYVAILPTSDATIDITATSGGKGYYKTLTTTKSYAASSGYNVSWRMTQGANLSKLTADYTAQDGDILTGTLASNLKLKIAAGATVTLAGMTHHAGDYINSIECLGTANIILAEGTTNDLTRGSSDAYAGLFLNNGTTWSTLTISGTGTLRASGGFACAGIGGINYCDDIVINGGTIYATGGQFAPGIGAGGNVGQTGNITINDGNITATGGEGAAGIGSGSHSSYCKDITIANTVTSVTAIKGTDASESIGRGSDGSSCGTVKFGTATMFDDSRWTTTPNSGNNYGLLHFVISTTTITNDTWTLTPLNQGQGGLQNYNVNPATEQ